MSADWQSQYRGLNVPSDEWDDDPLADARDKIPELRAIADSDAPDADLARIILNMINDEPIDEETQAALTPDPSDV